MALSRHGDDLLRPWCAGSHLLGTVLHWRLGLELADMNTDNTGLLKIHTPRFPAGGYRMGDDENGGWILFSIPKKPRWIHRMGVRLVLGWKWVDA